MICSWLSFSWFKNWLQGKASTSKPLCESSLCILVRPLQFQKVNLHREATLTTKIAFLSIQFQKLISYPCIVLTLNLKKESTSCCSFYSLSVPHFQNMARSTDPIQNYNLLDLFICKAGFISATLIQSNSYSKPLPTSLSINHIPIIRRFDTIISMSPLTFRLTHHLVSNLSIIVAFQSPSELQLSYHRDRNNAEFFPNHLARIQRNSKISFLSFQFLDHKEGYLLQGNERLGQYVFHSLHFQKREGMLIQNAPSHISRYQRWFHFLDSKTGCKERLIIRSPSQIIHCTSW